MMRFLLGLAAAATAACAAQEPAVWDPPEEPPAAARPGAGTPAPAEPAAPAVPVAPVSSVAPADPAVRRRLVDAVNMSYRLAAESRPAAAKVLGEFAPPSVASANALRLPRGEARRACEEGRSWAGRYRSTVGGVMRRAVDSGEPARPRPEHAEDLRRRIGDHDADIRCRAADGLKSSATQFLQPLYKQIPFENMKREDFDEPSWARPPPGGVGDAKDDNRDAGGLRLGAMRLRMPGR